MIIFFNYLTIAIIFTGIFVIGWTAVCLATEALLKAMFNYNLKLAEESMQAKEWNAAQVYNERLSSICKWMNNVERAMFFDLF